MSLGVANGSNTNLTVRGRQRSDVAIPRGAGAGKGRVMASNADVFIDTDMWNRKHMDCPRFWALISARFCPYCGQQMGASTAIPWKPEASDERE